MTRLASIVLLLPLVMACGQELSSTKHAVSNHFTQVGDAATQASKTDNDASQPTLDRKIIYRASIDLHVKSFAEADRRIVALVNESGGYIAQFREDRLYGSQRGGHWTVRVPIAKFTGLLDAVGQLGVAERREVQSQDVTEEFVDLDSRLKNKKVLESRLLELVSKRGDEIKDVLALESELSRVREEIEKLEGRLRYLADRVTLTTIEIGAFERLDYQPPEATFSQRIATTFSLSLDNLRQFAEVAILVFTALAPWAVVATILFLPIGIVIRRRRSPPAPVTPVNSAIT